MSEEQTTDNTSMPEVDPQAQSEHVKKPAPNDSRLNRFKAWYAERKKWTIPATILAVILILAAVPFTRYNLAGLVLKKNISVKIVDATANTPVSGATVSVGSISAQTDSAGVATLHHIKVGNHKATLSKKYYKDEVVNLLAPIFSQKSTPIEHLSATGRQVKITVTNLIDKSVLADVDIKVAGTTAKTDQKGTALIVLPVDATQQKATLSLDGYNDASVTVKVSNDTIQNNNFSLTPAGKVYFLSKLSGKIDVVKTNLDGTDRQTVLAGTGHEDDNNTVLLASRDWKFLALLSRRAGSNPTLYLIDTSSDSLSTIDEGNADFNLSGWAGNNFVYTVTRNDVQLWQANRQVLKSFNANTKKTTILDQTTASGSSNFDYLTQLIGSVYAYDNQVFYIINWSSAFNDASMTQLASKQSTFNSINPDGSGKKSIRSFGLAAGTQSSDVTLDERIKSPSDIELHFSDGTKDNFYTYANGQIKDNPSNSASNFYSSAYPTYLLSPSGNNTFWSEPRDGKNTLFIGDEDGQNGKQVATLSDYSTYGWYTDNYLLVSKSSSELYIMSKDAQNVIKISDYHKPAVNFPGYGGGYGGL